MTTQTETAVNRVAERYTQIAPPSRKRDNLWSEVPRVDGEFDDGLGAARGFMVALAPSLAIWAVALWMIYEFVKAGAR
jgi:hypothetical protein